MIKFINSIISDKKSAFHFPREVQIEGDITSSIAGFIDGLVEGNIKMESDLTLSSNAVIKGDVYAQNLLLQGKVFGNIYCEKKITFSNGSYLKGNASAAVLDVQAGSVVEGVLKKHTNSDTTVVIPEVLIDDIKADLSLKQPSTNESSENWF